MKGGAAAVSAGHHSELQTGAARRSTFPRLAHFAMEYLLVLPAGALIALVWANASPESYFQFAFSSAFVVNDVAMVFFFALMTKEIVEATVLGGVLHPWRRAVLPVIAAAGATLPAALLYLPGVRLFDEPMLEQGWPLAFAVDLAAVFFIARIIFGRHPAVPFLLLLGIAANGAGLILLATRGASTNVEVGTPAIIMATALAVCWALRKHRVNAFWPYVAVSGTLFWWAFRWLGVHPAFALVPIIPFLPHARRDPGFFVDAPPDARDALNHLELWFRVPAQVALFLFALVNAGVVVRSVESGVWALPLTAFVARPLGLLAAVALALAAGLHLPHRVGWRELLVIGLISGTGFTMALFFATVVTGPGQLLSEMKLGAMLTALVGAAAIPAARLLRVGRFAR